MTPSVLCHNYCREFDSRSESQDGIQRASPHLYALKVAIVSPTAHLSTNVNAEVTRDSVVVAPTATSVPEKLACLMP
ncbi:hypothetical protein AVEN_106598-1 [Araneus ventricosus]|uniref:Uncharacterized protein n=1 Tax=Araneus ventricosus TaxID=182803 RepID=A0A4Y2IW08_ARAVE|nr:hypothetical protein AVEN_106598-1 [Araneus ventricosus]